MFSRVRLFATPWTVARQTPLSTGIFQARTLEWVAISFPRGSSPPRNHISSVSRISRQVLYQLCHPGGLKSCKKMSTMKKKYLKVCKYVNFCFRFRTGCPITTESGGKMCSYTVWREQARTHTPSTWKRERRVWFVLLADEVRQWPGAGRLK